MSDPKFRPVVALDLDGVLRVPPAHPGDQPRDLITIAPIVYRRAEYPTVHHSHPPWNRAGEFTDGYDEEFSRVGVEWVRGLVDRDVDIVWATTWQHHANRYFGPALGLPEFPVAVVDDGSRFPEPSEWKAEQLGRDARWAGRPLVWVDDAYQTHARLERRRRPADRALTWGFGVSSPFHGLVQHEIHELDAWLALASTPEGHAELRRRRRAIMQLAATQRRIRGAARH